MRKRKLMVMSSWLRPSARRDDVRAPGRDAASISAPGRPSCQPCARWQACQTGRTVPSLRAFELCDDQLERRDGAPVGVPGAVEVRVVQEDHVAGRSRRAMARAAIRRGRRELAPVLAPARPQQRPQAGRPRRAQPGRAVDPVRRPVPDAAATPVASSIAASPAGQVVGAPRARSAAAAGGAGSRAARQRDRRPRSRPRARGGAPPARRSTKNVARAPARASTSSTAGVPSGCGPSSKVSATPVAAGQACGAATAQRRRPVDGGEKWRSTPDDR